MQGWGLKFTAVKLGNEFFSPFILDSVWNRFCTTIFDDGCSSPAWSLRKVSRFVGHCLIQPYNFTEHHHRQVNGECVCVCCLIVWTCYTQVKTEYECDKMKLSDFIRCSQCVKALFCLRLNIGQFIWEVDISLLFIAALGVEPANHKKERKKEKMVHLMYRSNLCFHPSTLRKKLCHAIFVTIACS